MRRVLQVQTLSHAAFLPLFVCAPYPSPTAMPTPTPAPCAVLAALRATLHLSCQPPATPHPTKLRADPLPLCLPAQCLLHYVPHHTRYLHHRSSSSRLFGGRARPDAALPDELLYEPLQVRVGRRGRGFNSQYSSSRLFGGRARPNLVLLLD